MAKRKPKHLPTGEELEEDIAMGNLGMGFDQAVNYDSLSDALAAYMVNAIDTARENRVSADAVASIYMREVLAELKCKKARKSRSNNPTTSPRASALMKALKF